MTIPDFRRDLLLWYQREGRGLPWRVEGGSTPDPYVVWLTEIMCQQTSVTTAAPYLEKFLKRWPNLADFAAASLDEILHAWAGLGYYRRARLAHQTALAVVKEHGGQFPREHAKLLALPGIGAYTAAAIASIAFGAPHLAIDGNLKRVFARIGRLDAPADKLHPVIESRFGPYIDPERPGDFNQALMDLAARLCRPKKPLCTPCPVQNHCEAFRHAVQNEFPRKKPKKSIPTKVASAFLLRHEGGIVMRQRPTDAMLGGMWEVPTNEWEIGHDFSLAQAAPDPYSGLVSWRDLNWRELGAAHHSFTHFHLRLQVFYAEDFRAKPLQTPLASFDQSGRQKLAIPTLMVKVLQFLDLVDEPQ